MKHRRLYTAVFVTVACLAAFVGWQAVAGVTFDRRFEVAAPPDDVWDVLVRSFEDSTDSPIWPRTLEQVSTPKMMKGANVDATYRLGRLGDSEQAYRIVEFEPAQHTLTYRNGYGHPLEGGATVEIRPTEAGSSVRWSGHYRVTLTPRSQISAAFVRFVFLNRFFDLLERRSTYWASSRSK